MRDWFMAYRMRLKRRRLLWRSFRARHQLVSRRDLTGQIGPDDILAVVVLRNELLRLPHFLDHYRRLGVTQFLMVDNDSTDGSTAYLLDQPDVSLWTTSYSYRNARFGMLWANWLLWRYGRGHWCVTVDVDELLVYPHWRDADLPTLTRHLDRLGREALGALMIEAYPRHAIGQDRYRSGDDPMQVLAGFDPGPYRAHRKPDGDGLCVQGGVRERVFFADHPDRGPTLNKLPLVKWHWRYVYTNSTHAMLPSDVNHVYEGPGDARLSGCLLHTKFLPDAGARGQIEKQRKEHFGDPSVFDGYYDKLAENPCLWTDISVPYEGWEQLVALGLMGDEGWTGTTPR